jgi:hypothetical protein
VGLSEQSAYTRQGGLNMPKTVRLTSPDESPVRGFAPEIPINTFEWLINSNSLKEASDKNTILKGEIASLLVSRPHSNSVLDEADAKLPKMPPSVQVSNALSMAVEYIDEVLFLLKNHWNKNANSFINPPFMLFVALRSAIESSSLAVTLLSGSGSKEIAKFAGVCARDQCRGYRKLTSLASLVKPSQEMTSAAEKCEALYDSVAAECSQLDIVKERFTYTGCVETADKLVSRADNSFSCEFIWRLLSGFAHENVFVKMFYADVITNEDIDESIASRTLRLPVDLATVAIRAAHENIEYATERFNFLTDINNEEQYGNSDS